MLDHLGVEAVNDIDDRSDEAALPSGPLTAHGQVQTNSEGSNFATVLGNQTIEIPRSLASIAEELSGGPARAACQKGLNPYSVPGVVQLSQQLIDLCRGPALTRGIDGDRAAHPLSA